MRVTEILPTPASCGLGAQPEGQRRRDKLLPSRRWSPCGPRPAQRAGCPGRGVPGTRGPGSRRSAPPSPQTLAMPAQPARRRCPPPRWRTTVRGTGKQTVRWGPPSCARPRERPGRRRAHRDAAGTRGGGGRPADGLARGCPVPAPSPAARAPGPCGTELGRTPELWVGTHLRPRLCSEAAGARGAGGAALRAGIGPGSPRSPPPSTLPGRSAGLAAAAPPRFAGDSRPGRPAGPLRRAGKRETVPRVPPPPPRRLPHCPPASPLSPSPSKLDRRQPGGGGVGWPDPARAALTSAGRGHRAGRAGARAAGPPAAHAARLGLAGRAPTAGRTGNSIPEPGDDGGGGWRGVAPRAAGLLALAAMHSRAAGPLVGRMNPPIPT